MGSEIADLKSLDDELAKDFMRGLWMREETLRRETQEHRHTSSQLYYAVEGSGVTEAAGEKLAWQAGDFFVVPNWSWHRHKNSSATVPAVFFSTTDRPLQEAIGVYREEMR